MNAMFARVYFNFRHRVHFNFIMARAGSHKETLCFSVLGMCFSNLVFVVILALFWGAANAKVFATIP